MIRVLYIEDNEDNIFLFKRRLGKRGFEILIARMEDDPRIGGRQSRLPG